MDKKFLKLDDISSYKKYFQLANYVWSIVKKWDILSQKTVGEQFIRSTDSVSANIVEGFGKYQKKDKIRFYRIGYGSITESLDWNEKANKRNLLSQKEYDYISRIRLHLTRIKKPLPRSKSSYRIYKRKIINITI